MKLPIDIIVPQETVNDDVVHVNWLVSTGDFINEGDRIVEIETSKSTVDIEAVQEGIIEIILPNDSEVKVGDVIGRITDKLSTSDKSAFEMQKPKLEVEINDLQTENNNVEKIVISNKAKALIKKHNIDINNFSSLNFIRESDVANYIQKTKDNLQETINVDTIEKGNNDKENNSTSNIKYSIWEEAKRSSNSRKKSIIWLILNYIFRNWFLNGIVRWAPYGVIIWVHKLRGVTIGKGCFIDPSAIVETAYPENIIIGNDVRITARSVIMTHIKAPNHLRARGFIPFVLKPVILEDHCFIGVNATILPGVTIGKGAVVASGAVVTANVPEYCMVSGNPAKVVKEFIKK
jgi:acetyltransferase-like isoleucine patch superfamily enzyme